MTVITVEYKVVGIIVPGINCEYFGEYFGVHIYRVTVSEIVNKKIKITANVGRIMTYGYAETINDYPSIELTENMSAEVFVPADGLFIGFQDIIGDYRDYPYDYEIKFKYSLVKETQELTPRTAYVNKIHNIQTLTLKYNRLKFFADFADIDYSNYLYNNLNFWRLMGIDYYIYNDVTIDFIHYVAEEFDNSEYIMRANNTIVNFYIPEFSPVPFHMNALLKVNNSIRTFPAVVNIGDVVKISLSIGFNTFTTVPVKNHLALKSDTYNFIAEYIKILYDDIPESGNAGAHRVIELPKLYLIIQ